ncbi:GTPase RhebL1, partial [Eschrichtius robustus]|nr:GTPase RhebL1 [Eschrichtius robustus]
YSKIVTLGKDEFHLHLVDTAGQDEYSILPYSFIIGVHGYVLVYSVTSLHRLPVVLVGNKADLSPDREVQAVEGKKLAESWGATFMESSARDKQVLGLKIRKVVGVAVLWHCLVVGMLTQGIFTKVIQEIARVENSYGQERRCHLIPPVRGAAVIALAVGGRGAARALAMFSDEDFWIAL